MKKLTIFVFFTFAGILLGPATVLLICFGVWAELSIMLGRPLRYREELDELRKLVKARLSNKFRKSQS